MITVGITAFNSGIYLSETIKSVLEQKCDQWFGVIIIDGGSDRITRRIFDKFNHPKFKKYIFKNNQGPYSTRQKAIELSDTEWYCQLDGDDLLPVNAVNDITEAIKKNPDAEFIYGNCEYFSKGHSEIRKPVDDPDYLCKSPLFNAASPIKKSLFYNLGGFYDGFFINADWDFWLSIYENNILGVYTNNLIYKRRQVLNSVGNKFLHLRPDIVEKIIERHPSYFSSQNRKNIARFHVYEQMARRYKAIGNRKKAAEFARKALEYGDQVPAFKTIFDEENMSTIRYTLRRLGRIF